MRICTDPTACEVNAPTTPHPGASTAETGALLHDLAGVNVDAKQAERTAEATVEAEPGRAPTLYLGKDGTRVPVRRAELAAGLDSMVKPLIRDALPIVIDHVEEAEGRFREFVRKKIASDDKSELLAAALSTGDPRTKLVEKLVAELTSQSLQSKQQVLSAAAHFGLTVNQLMAKPNVYDQVFRARNEIAHEMDIDFDQPRRSRTPRHKATTVGQAQAVLDCAARFLAGVDRQLQAD